MPFPPSHGGLTGHVYTGHTPCVQNMTWAPLTSVHMFVSTRGGLMVNPQCLKCPHKAMATHNCSLLGDLSQRPLEGSISVGNSHGYHRG